MRRQRKGRDVMSHRAGLGLNRSRASRSDPSGSAERGMRMMGLFAPARGETAGLVIAWLRNSVRCRDGQRTFEQCSPSPSATAPPSPCDPSQVATSPPSSLDE